jgi:hypothetical protein
MNIIAETLYKAVHHFHFQVIVVGERQKVDMRIKMALRGLDPAYMQMEDVPQFINGIAQDMVFEFEDGDTPFYPYNQSKWNVISMPLVMSDVRTYLDKSIKDDKYLTSYQLILNSKTRPPLIDNLYTAGNTVRRMLLEEVPQTDPYFLPNTFRKTDPYKSFDELLNTVPYTRLSFATNQQSGTPIYCDGMNKYLPSPLGGGKHVAPKHGLQFLGANHFVMLHHKFLKLDSGLPLCFEKVPMRPPEMLISGNTKGAQKIENIWDDSGDWICQFRGYVPCPSETGDRWLEVHFFKEPGADFDMKHLPKWLMVGLFPYTAN